MRRILADVAGALHAAHEAGVVHRDIKPDNILLEGDERRALVTDFGIAKALDASDSALTGTGVAIGSPDYMTSPEQAAGEPLDHRADIYSLGVVAYEMIAGQLPFGEGTVTTVLLRHTRETAPQLLDLRPACPSPLAAAIARCLEKVPTARWGSKAELREALLTARQESSPAEVAPMPTIDRGLAVRGEGLMACIKMSSLLLKRRGISSPVWKVKTYCLHPWEKPRACLCPVMPSFRRHYHHTRTNSG